MRIFPRTLRLGVAVSMVFYFGVLHVAPALAGLAPSRVSGATAIGSARDADLIVVQRAIENKIVAQKLRDYGVSRAELQARLATMSDQDLHTLASATKGLPSGGDGGVDTLIGVLLIVLLVILILKLLNKEVIVK